MNDKLGKWRSLGLAVSFAGVVLVAGTPDVSGNAKGFALVLLAAMSWAVSNFVMKKTSESSILQVLGWMALFGAPQLYLVSWLFEEGQAEALRNITIPAATGLLYTILMSTIAAYGLWYHLMKIYPVSMVAPFSLLVPISGVSLSVLVFSEVLTTKMLVGGALTIIGVAIIVIRRPKLAVQGE